MSIGLTAASSMLIFILQQMEEDMSKSMGIGMLISVAIFGFVMFVRYYARTSESEAPKQVLTPTAAQNYETAIKKWQEEKEILNRSFTEKEKELRNLLAQQVEAGKKDEVDKMSAEITKMKKEWEEWVARKPKPQQPASAPAINGSNAPANGSSEDPFK